MRPLSLATVLCALSSAGAQTLASKVMVIGIDGVRADAFDAASTPNLDALVANGTYAHGVNLAATISGPGWSNVLCGVGMSKHGVRNNSFSGSNYGQYPSFFTRIRQACPNALLASIVHWTPINSQIVEDVDWELSGNDASVSAQAVQLLANENPDVMLLHFDDVDRAGHGSGFSPTNASYLSAISTVDSLIGNVVAAVDARSNRANENWLYIVTSDHGGVGTGHGGLTIEHRQVPFIVSGMSAVTGGTPAVAPRLVDVATTLFTFLGIPIDPVWNLDGRPVALSGTPTVPPSAFVCLDCPRGLVARADQLAGTIDLSWVVGAVTGATGYELRRDGALLATLPPAASSYVDSFRDLEPRHAEIRYELRSIGGASSQCVVSRASVTVSTGDVRLFEDFEAYADDSALVAAGWALIDENNPVEAATWTLANPGGRANPPRSNGRASQGQFLILDSDAGGSGALQNPTGSGMSHDVWSPAFDCTGMSAVWLHCSCSAVLNNNGQAVFDVDVSTDGGGSWSNAFRRVAPDRTGFAPIVSTSNAGSYYGRLDVDLSPWAADKPGVRFRIRHFEPNWDWWIAIDDVVVDDLDLGRSSAFEILPVENFDGGVPANWTTNGQHSGAATWTALDPCTRSIVTGSGGVFNYQGGRGVFRLGSTFAIMDSSCAGNAGEDELLITPALDCSLAQSVFLHFRSETVVSSSATQQVLVSLNGGVTFEPTPLFEYNTSALSIGEDTFFGEHTFEIPTAAGEQNVAFGFRYASGGNAWFWAVDDVRVTGSVGRRAGVRVAGPGCSAGVPPTMTATLPIVGTTIRFRGQSAPAVPVASLGFSMVPPSNSDLFGCTTVLDLSGAGMPIVPVPLQIGPGGATSLDLALRNDPVLAGFDFAAQAFFLVTASAPGFDLSNGLHLRMGF